MRIVFLCTSSLDYPSPRGRWLPLARRLARDGHEPHLLMLHPTFDRLHVRQFDCDGVDCAYVGQMHVYGLPGERRHFGALELASVSLRGALALAQAALRLRPDVVHVAKPQPINGLAGILAARSGAAMYVDCDDYEAAANRFGGAWQRRVVAWWEDRLPRLARGVSVNTRFLYDRLQRLGVPEQRLRYVPNGVDLDRQTTPDARQVAALRAALGLTHNPTVVYLGAISAVAHGVRLLIDAFAILSKRLPAARLVVVGDGDDRPALMAYARARGLERMIIWAGRIPPEAALTWLAVGDCSVDPVHDTPAAAARSPLKIVESMAAGVPVVTGDVGDRREMIGDVAGLIVPSGDAQALADGIATLLTDPACRMRLAQGARLRAEVYNWNRLARTWQTLYQIGA
ncbi:MAG: glycosyltransferase family 4 protein [Roseiflexus sp.]|nr:glycosyltransferase family 4 protein [Roseiflexus sp.]